MAEHDHEHDHPHDHGPPAAPVDPAQKALADALRVCFGILKLAMIALVVAYLFTGLYQVQPQEQAVQLVFGKITGTGEDRIKRQGWHFNWPFPVGQVVKVPTATQTLTLTDTFMFEIGERDRGRSYDQMSGRALNPERDGALITADAGLVHGVFNVSYTITDPARFIETIGDLNERPAAFSHGDDPTAIDDTTNRQRFDAIMRTALEHAIVHVTANTDSDDFIAGRANQTSIKAHAQKSLDALGDGGLGVTIGEVTLNQPTVPLSVRANYNRVAQAENIRSETINTAQTTRRQTLGGAGGAAALPVDGGEDGPLVRLIKDYELAAEAGDTALADQLKARLDEAYRSLRVTVDGAAYDIGGEAARVINQSRTERTALVQDISASTNTFRKQLEAYRKDPEFFRRRQWSDMLARVFAAEHDLETFVAPKGQLYLEVNRDPEVTRERERKRIEADREARQNQP